MRISTIEGGMSTPKEAPYKNAQRIAKKSHYRAYRKIGKFMYDFIGYMRSISRYFVPSFTPTSYGGGGLQSFTEKDRVKRNRVNRIARLARRRNRVN